MNKPTITGNENSSKKATVSTPGTLATINIIYMKLESLLFIIAICCLIFIIIGWAIGGDDDHPQNKKIAKYIVLISGCIMIMNISIILTTPFFIRKYMLEVDQDLWEKYRLPQIDSKMQLKYSDSHSCIIKSICKDSIRHDYKSIEYDVFDIYKISDGFKNEKINKILTIEFKKPNLIRDSLRTITLRKDDYLTITKIDTLTISQCDSVLKSWNIYNSTYKRLLK